MAKECLFCGDAEAGALTNEHINPKWLLEYLALPADDMMFQGIASTETGDLIGKPRLHSSFAFVHGRVCASCNGGWMARLESAIKPIMGPLTDSTRTIESLSPHDARLLGKWAAKTAYLHTHVGLAASAVPLQHLKALHGDHGLPLPRVGVFAMQADYSQPTAYIHTGYWPQLTPFEMPSGVHTPAGAYKIGLQYRRLHLLVAFWPNLKSVLTRVKGVHSRLLPLEGPDEEYEFPIPGSAGPLGNLKSFTEWLAVTHSEPNPY